MIQNKSKPIVLLLITLLFSIGLSAQSVFFNYADGSNASYNLEDVRKITFDLDLMNLHLFDGSVYAWNVSTIGYYDFNDNPAAITELLNNANSWEVIVFPNPINTDLQIHYVLPEKDQIIFTVYDLQGKLLITLNAGNRVKGKHQESIDMSNLPVGQYVFRISGQKNTISKQVIKQ